MLQEEFIREHKRSYIILDVSADELAKAGGYYTKQQIDFEKEDIPDVGIYDLLFAQMTLQKPLA